MSVVAASGTAGRGGSSWLHGPASDTLLGAGESWLTELSNDELKKLLVLDRLLLRLKKNNSRVLIFSQMTRQVRLRVRGRVR